MRQCTVRELEDIMCNGAPAQPRRSLRRGARGTLVVSIVTALIALVVIANMLLACLLSVLVPIYPFKWLSEKSRPPVRRSQRRRSFT